MSVDNRTELLFDQSVQTTQAANEERPATLEEVNRAIQGLQRDPFTGFVLKPERREELFGARFSLVKARDKLPRL